MDRDSIGIEIHDLKRSEARLGIIWLGLAQFISWKYLSFESIIVQAIELENKFALHPTILNYPLTFRLQWCVEMDSYKETPSNIKFIPFLLSGSQLGFILRYLSAPAFTSPSLHLSHFSPVPFRPTRCQIWDKTFQRIKYPKSSSRLGSRN